MKRMVLVAQLEQDKAEEQQVERSRDLHVEVWKERQKHKQSPLHNSRCHHRPPSQKRSKILLPDQSAESSDRSAESSDRSLELFEKQWA